jgi:hypothetical protein
VSDLYFEWLGIPETQRPPTYYQLLGIAPSEESRFVIETAAARRTRLVEARFSGPRAADARRIADEIARARQAILDPAARSRYDARESDIIPRAWWTADAPAPPPVGGLVRDWWRPDDSTRDQLSLDEKRGSRQSEMEANEELVLEPVPDDESEEQPAESARHGEELVLELVSDHCPDDSPARPDAVPEPWWEADIPAPPPPASGPVQGWWRTEASTEDKLLPDAARQSETAELVQKPVPDDHCSDRQPAESTQHGAELGLEPIDAGDGPDEPPTPSVNPSAGLISEPVSDNGPDKTPDPPGKQREPAAHPGEWAKLGKSRRAKRQNEDANSSLPETGGIDS